MESNHTAVLISEVTRLRTLLRELTEASEQLFDPKHECGANCDDYKPCPIGERARAAIAAAKGAVR
jgi:hypothetical protein